MDGWRERERGGEGERTGCHCVVFVDWRRCMVGGSWRIELTWRCGVVFIYLLKYLHSPGAKKLMN